MSLRTPDVVESPVSPVVGQAVLACQSARAEPSPPPKQIEGR
jgi:hypothetical protein